MVYTCTVVNWLELETQRANGDHGSLLEKFKWTKTSALFNWALSIHNCEQRYSRCLHCDIQNIALRVWVCTKGVPSCLCVIKAFVRRDYPCDVTAPKRKQLLNRYKSFLFLSVLFFPQVGPQWRTCGLCFEDVGRYLQKPCLINVLNNFNSLAQHVHIDVIINMELTTIFLFIS